MTTSYATAIEFRQRTRKTVTIDDPAIEDLLLAASETIDTYCNKQNGFMAASTTTARLYTGTGTVHQWIDECVAVTLVEVKQAPTDSVYVAWASTDWIAATGDPEAPDFNALPYQFILVDPTGDKSHFTSGRYSVMRGFRPEDDWRGRGAPTVRVTAKWGYSVEAPAAIKNAAITLAARWLKRGESAWADTLGSAEMGQLMYRQKIDPDIALMLERYRVPSIGRNAP